MLVTTESVSGLRNYFTKNKNPHYVNDLSERETALSPLTHCLNAARKVLKRGMIV